MRLRQRHRRVQSMVAGSLPNALKRRVQRRACAAIIRAIFWTKPLHVGQISRVDYKIQSTGSGYLELIWIDH